MTWYTTVLKNYAGFGGRARRKEFWWFQLCQIVILLILFILDLRLGTTGSARPGLGVLSGLYALGTFIPALAVEVRRLHDTGRSGWWVLFGLVPLVGPIVLLVFLLQDSHPGENQYGPNPKAAGSFSNAPQPG
jgi:uncharacterized membrane protein YhaH (DUF805 family)